jgi:hypothetical protein
MNFIKFVRDVTSQIMQKWCNIITNVYTDIAAKASIKISDRGHRGSLSYGGWIYNYLCNQCQFTSNVVSSNSGQAMCNRYIIMLWSLSVTCGRSVLFSRYSGFPHRSIWPPWYNWNIVEHGFNHYKPNQTNQTESLIYCTVELKKIRLPIQYNENREVLCYDI